MRFDAAQAGWRTLPAPGWTSTQKDWLTGGGSLTARLAQLGPVTVGVTRETVGQPWADESIALGGRTRAPVWVREVVLMVAGVPFVAAHSIAPLAASCGVWQAMRRLRTRPLAELLYQDPRVARSPLASRRVLAGHPLFSLALAACDGRQVGLHALLARRSVFERGGAPLLVTECMLPALWRHLSAACLRADEIT